jgi:hypothetical protein
LPSARTASLAVFHETPSPSATRATVRCWHTMPSSAHRRPRRDSLGPRLRRLGGVLAPQMCAAGAPVLAEGDHQRGRAPTERFVRQPANHCVAGCPFASAAAAPLVGLDDAAGQHCPVGFESLAGDLESELVESAKGGQVRAGESLTTGSVGHVEVFRMGIVRTSILGRPRPLFRHRRAHRPTTCATPSTVKSRHILRGSRDHSCGRRFRTTTTPSIVKSLQNRYLPSCPSEGFDGERAHGVRSCALMGI